MFSLNMDKIGCNLNHRVENLPGYAIVVGIVGDKYYTHKEPFLLANKIFYIT